MRLLRFHDFRRTLDRVRQTHSHCALFFCLVGGAEILEWWNVALRLADKPKWRFVWELIRVVEMLFFDDWIGAWLSVINWLLYDGCRLSEHRPDTGYERKRRPELDRGVKPAHDLSFFHSLVVR